VTDDFRAVNAARKVVFTRTLTAAEWANTSRRKSQRRPVMKDQHRPDSRVIHVDGYAVRVCAKGVAGL
jgi:hypothetical protein